jgi:hypothetical protein
METQAFAEALENAFHGVLEMGVVEQLRELKRKINTLDSHRTPVIVLPPKADWSLIPFNMLVTNRLDSIPQTVLAQDDVSLQRIRTHVEEVRPLSSSFLTVLV